MSTLDNLKAQALTMSDRDAAKLLQAEGGYGIMTARDLITKWRREAKINAAIERCEQISLSVSSTVPYPQLCAHVANIHREMADIWRVILEVA